MRMHSEASANQALATYAVQGIASALHVQAQRAEWARVLTPAPSRQAKAKARNTLIGRLFGRSV